jgi:hypothetical protein
MYCSVPSLDPEQWLKALGDIFLLGEERTP